jgi:hypothetical protein
LTHENHRHPLRRFFVKRRRELTSMVVPFFEQHPLITAKRADFVAFASVLRMMEEGAPHGDGAPSDRCHHRADEPARAVSVPGILRGHTPTSSDRCRAEDMVLASRRRGDN